MLLAEDLRLADQVRNLEVLIEGTGCKQRRLPVVICAHRQNLIQEMREKRKQKENQLAVFEWCGITGVGPGTERVVCC